MTYRFALFAALLAAVCLTIRPAQACPFCNAVSQTLRQEMAAMDAVVIGTALESDATRNKETGEVLMRIEQVLKGDELVAAKQEIKAVYYGDVTAGRRFLLSGVDPPNMQWSCLPLSRRAEKYVVDRHRRCPITRWIVCGFTRTFCRTEESMLARDAYDEFALAPYDSVRALGPEMNHDQLIEWIRDPEMSTDRKRLYLTMLGVCGNEKDLPFLEELLRSTQKSTRGGLDALIACYLTLLGREGPAVD